MSSTADAKARPTALAPATGRRIDVCGIGVDQVDLAETVELAMARCRQGAGEPMTIFSCNVDMVVKASRDPAFAQVLSSGSLVTADGMPIVVLGRWLGGRLPERVTGADLVPVLSAACAANGFSVFFLGAAEGVAAEAAASLRRKHPGLRVAGTLSPPRNFEKDPATLAATIEAVRAADPDVLFVALGAPRQERFIVEHARALGARVQLGIGAAVDMAAGRVRRAPALVQRLGAEWLWRLGQEPRRLARRYLVEDVAFAALAVRSLLSRRRPRDETEPTGAR